MGTKSLTRLHQDVSKYQLFNSTQRNHHYNHLDDAVDEEEPDTGVRAAPNGALTNAETFGNAEAAKAVPNRAAALVFIAAQEGASSIKVYNLGKTGM